jgi:hypothetical protein
VYGIQVEEFDCSENIKAAQEIGSRGTMLTYFVDIGPLLKRN